MPTLASVPLAQRARSLTAVGLFMAGRLMLRGSEHLLGRECALGHVLAQLNRSLARV